MTKAPRSSIPAARGRLTSTVTPARVPTRIIGMRRRYSPRDAFFGFSSPTLNELAMSASTYSARANLSGTKCVASGIATSAAPKPIAPKMIEPAKANPASRKYSAGKDQLLGGAAVHVAQAVHIPGERQAVTGFESRGAILQFIPSDGRRQALERKNEDVRVVER